MTLNAATTMQSAVDEALAEALRRQPTEEEIRQRAYEIFLARGSAPGHDLDDWLQAEGELRSSK